MKIPEGRQKIQAHVNAKVYERVKVGAVKRKVYLSTVLDEAFKLWLDAQREEK